MERDQSKTPDFKPSHRAWGRQNKSAPEHRTVKEIRERLPKTETPPAEPPQPLDRAGLIRHRMYDDPTGKQVIFQRIGFKIIRGEETEVVFVSSEDNPGFEQAIPLADFLANNAPSSLNMKSPHFLDPRTLGRKSPF